MSKPHGLETIEIASKRRERRRAWILEITTSLEYEKLGFKRWGFEQIRGYLRKKAFFPRLRKRRNCLRARMRGCAWGVMCGWEGGILLFSPTVWAGNRGERKDTHTGTHAGTYMQMMHGDSLRGGNGRGGDSTPPWEVQCLSAMVPWHPDRHITFFTKGRPKSAQQLRDSTVAARRAQSVTVPSSWVSRECRSPRLRSPPLKNARFRPKPEKNGPQMDF